MNANLRDRLRVETADIHGRLDARLSSYDMSTVPGRDGFLTAMTAGYVEALRFPYVEGSAAREIALRNVIAMGAAVPAVRSVGQPIDEDAAAYVFTGAHLGMRVLARTWRAATEDGLPGLLDQPVLTADWQALVARLAGIDGATARADRTVADARRLFAAFHEAAVGVVQDEVRAA